jgi:hypothetical protein
MELDIRLPIGLMFLLLGPILFACGLADHAAISEYTALAMIAFGLPMFVFGVRGGRRPRAGQHADAPPKAGAH